MTDAIEQRQAENAEARKRIEDMADRWDSAAIRASADMASDFDTGYGHALNVTCWCGPEVIHVD